MSAGDRRPKAQDRFERSRPRCGAQASLEEAYPDIEDLTLEVEEYAFSPTASRRTYTKQHFPGEFVDCTTRLCSSGGFCVGGMLRQAVRARKAYVEDAILCGGYEGHPKGKGKHRTCSHSFKAKLWIQYKDRSST
jgi:hypothetical protein